MGGPEYQVAYAALTVMVFVLGACIGSFLNVCIYRIPLERSVVRPGSQCPGCGAAIAWYDNIPVLSYVRLRARCRRCGGPISARYPLVEFLTAVLFLLAWLKLGIAPGPRPLGLTPVIDFWVVPILWLGLSGLVLATFVDIDHMIIPDRVTIGGMIAGPVLSGLVPALHGTDTVAGGILSSAVGIAAGAGILWSIAGLGSFMFRKDAMGLGDVKLLGAIGAFLGWRAVLFTVVVSSFVGAATGLSLVALGRKEMKGRIPYGPHLALAAAVWVFWGQGVWNWWVGRMFPDLPPAT